MTLAVIFDSVGAGEWLVLLAVLLIVMGPKRLPSTARKIGAYYSKFRRAADSFKRQLMEMDMEMERELQKAEKEAEDALKIPDASDLSNGPDASGANDGETGYYDNPDYTGETAEEPKKPVDLTSIKIHVN